MSEVYDRGNIKWTAMMLPEHVELLQDLNKQQEYKSKPILDEQQMEFHGFKLAEAANKEKEVWIKYYRNHDFCETVGYVKMEEPFDNYFQCRNDDGVTRIRFDSLIDVEIQ